MNFESACASCFTNSIYSFPVPPEVGKIGNNSPTFIQPVSERTDGIKSFFQKQQPSPNKKVEGAMSPKHRQGKDEKPSIIGVAEGIETKIEDDDDEKGLGDDSNAPNPTAKAEEKTSIEEEVGDKRKLGEEAIGDEEELEQTKPEKRGGHQIKVIRRTASDDSNKAVSRAV